MFHKKNQAETLLDFKKCKFCLALSVIALRNHKIVSPPPSFLALDLKKKAVLEWKQILSSQYILIVYLCLKVKNIDIVKTLWF